MIRKCWFLGILTIGFSTAALSERLVDFPLADLVAAIERAQKGDDALESERQLLNLLVADAQATGRETVTLDVDVFQEELTKEILNADTLVDWVYRGPNQRILVTESHEEGTSDPSAENLEKTLKMLSAVQGKVSISFGVHSRSQRKEERIPIDKFSILKRAFSRSLKGEGILQVQRGRLTCTRWRGAERANCAVIAYRFGKEALPLFTLKILNVGKEDALSDFIVRLVNQEVIDVNEDPTSTLEFDLDKARGMLLGDGTDKKALVKWMLEHPAATYQDFFLQALKEFIAWRATAALHTVDNNNNVPVDAARAENNTDAPLIQPFNFDVRTAVGQNSHF